jgi:hypothetical protein
LGSNHRGFETGDDRPSISDSKSNDYHLYDFDNVDARSSHAGDENAELHPDDLVIEEWLDQYREDEAMADPDAPAQPMVDRKPAQAIQRVRDRTRTIERALNEQAIPSRYADLLRRWAGRLEGVLEKRLPTDQSNANRAPTSGETSDNDD